MRHTEVAIFIHPVWATWDRLPLLTQAIERPIYRAMAATCGQHGAEPIGGVADHVHLLVRLSATLAIADLVKYVKGSSAHLITHELAPGHFFKWPGGYGAFSVSPGRLASASDYITRQQEHHATGALVAEWEIPPNS